jgi:hypothetical protein
MAGFSQVKLTSVRDGFVVDSALEGAGFEPSVPPSKEHPLGRVVQTRRRGSVESGGSAGVSTLPQLWDGCAPCIVLERRRLCRRHAGTFHTPSINTSGGPGPSLRPRGSRGPGLVTHKAPDLHSQADGLASERLLASAPDMFYWCGRSTCPLSAMRLPDWAGHLAGRFVYPVTTIGKQS